MANQSLSAVPHVVFGVFNLALPNIIAWGVVLLLFLLFALLRLPRFFEPVGSTEAVGPTQGDAGQGAPPKNLTRRAQRLLRAGLTLEDALPTRMPVYVSSVAYLFGAAALSALVLLILTGLTLSIFGPGWYHGSAAGHFVNSLHFWSVQALFASIVLHMLTKFTMAAWRDGRWKTWMVGMVIFGIAVFTGLTGFLSQTNWDSQWIAVQSKDAMNALGVGAFFNTMDTAQVLTLHVAVLPALVVALVLLHLGLVRHDGPVKPMPRQDRGGEGGSR